VSNLALNVEGIGKKYRLGAARDRYKTFRDALRSAVVSGFGFRRRPSPTFWALKDVSFQVRRGEVLGVIGRNGAGKSTLLKILSNVTEPTEGQATVYGKLGSLLEVGTGFHPELTGRENIFLNGAILGMPKSEISRRFDEIVAFAEIEQFLDTPAKRYSSGMYMRLAFSVAAHMVPDVLVVDEVLAVGDANFQKKCLGKMDDVAREGRTVLFVSHSMPTILRLCKRALLLDHGRVVLSGLPSQVVSAYLHGGTGSLGERVWDSSETAPGDDIARLHAIRVRDTSGNVVDTIDIGSPILVELEYWNLDNRAKTSANIQFYNDDGVCLFLTTDVTNHEWKVRSRRLGLVRSTCRIPGHFFAEGRVILRSVAVCSYNPPVVHAFEKDAVSFQVVDRSEGDGVRGPYAGDWPGVLRPMLEWELQDELGPPP